MLKSSSAFMHHLISGFFIIYEQCMFLIAYIDVILSSINEIKMINNDMVC
jgi:hypothetical protein